MNIANFLFKWVNSKRKMIHTNNVRNSYMMPRVIFGMIHTYGSYAMMARYISVYFIKTFMITYTSAIAHFIKDIMDLTKQPQMC